VFITHADSYEIDNAGPGTNINMYIQGIYNHISRIRNWDIGAQLLCFKIINRSSIQYILSKVPVFALLFHSLFSLSFIPISCDNTMNYDVPRYVQHAYRFLTLYIWLIGILIIFMLTSMNYYFHSYLI